MKVGYVGTFSGYPPGISATEQLVAGVRSYLESANRRGVLGREAIECVTADDRGDPECGAREASRLVEQEGVPVLVFVAASIVMEAVLAYAEEAHVPIAGTGGSLLPCFRPASPWLFTARTPYESHAAAMADELVRQGFRRIALISTKDGTGRSYAAGLRGMLERSGLAPATEVLLERRDTDLATAVRLLAGSEPDAVVCTHFSPTSGALFRESVRLGLSVQWAYGPSATNPETAQIIGSAGIEGSLGQSSFALPTSSGSAFAKFRADVRRHAPTAEVTSLTQLGYVSARAVVDAVRTSDRTGEGIRHELEHLAADYGMLPPFRLSPDDHLLNRGVQLVRFTKGAIAALGLMREVDPDTGELRTESPATSGRMEPSRSL